jgi:hypothetical protein
MKTVDSNESYISSNSLFHDITILGGGKHAVTELVGALCYKPEVRGFDSDEVIDFFN